MPLCGSSINANLFLIQQGDHVGHIEAPCNPKESLAPTLHHHSSQSGSCQSLQTYTPPTWLSGRDYPTNTAQYNSTGRSVFSWLNFCSQKKHVFLPPFGCRIKQEKKGVQHSPPKKKIRSDLLLLVLVLGVPN